MPADTAKALIALGSNLGDREGNLRAALAALAAVDGVRVLRVSAFIETDPVGGPVQGRYLNGAAVLETLLPPMELLNAMLAAESIAGRTRDGLRWGPRTADLDLLLYGDLGIDVPGLTLPHPRMHERRFVLVPASEVADEWVHPLLRRSIRSLLEDVPA